jgi:predicted phage tail protein
VPLTKIYLKGDLADKFTPELQACVSCAREAIWALEANYPGFRQYMVQSYESGMGYRVLVGEAWELRDDQLDLPTGRSTITIIPVVGGGGGPIGKIGLGIGMLALGLTGVGIPLVGLTASTMALTGGVLLLSGLMGLFNRPKDDKKEGRETSLIFNGAVNTVASGGVVPVVYGELLVGSQVISAGIRVVTEMFDDEDDSDD